MIMIDLPNIWSEIAKSSGLMERYGFSEVTYGEGLTTWGRKSGEDDNVLAVAKSMLDLRSELADLLLLFYV